MSLNYIRKVFLFFFCVRALRTEISQRKEFGNLYLRKFTYCLCTVIVFYTLANDFSVSAILKEVVDDISRVFITTFLWYTHISRERERARKWKSVRDSVLLFQLTVSDCVQQRKLLSERSLILYYWFLHLDPAKI